MKQLELQPVHTSILTEYDDIIDAIEFYGGSLIGPEDIVCVAETVVAITQNRVTRPEDLKPTWQARFLNRFVPKEGSMASIYGMQAAMDVEGEWKTLFWFFVGGVAKLFKKSGVFYKHVRQASLIDDVTGTMPPYDKYIVYGPEKADELCDKIVKRTGAYGAVVADVNDLKRSAVLGESRGINPKEIAQILIDNPFGNDSQMTPIVIIKNYASVSNR